jgi:tRNA(fMet)-specific endonuclease VapC
MPFGKRRTIIEDYFQSLAERAVPVLPYDRTAAERARLASVGMTPPFAYGQIAAVAAVNDLTLVTQNSGDFADFAGLRVEGW